MSHQPLPLLTPSVDAQFAGVLIANMLEAWLTAAPALEATEEAMNDHQDHRTALQQTGVHLYPSVDSGPGTASSGEYRTPVCAAGQSVGTGLARDGHPHVGPTCGWPSLASPVPTLCPAAHTGVRYSPDDAVPGPESTDGYRCTPVCCSAVR